MNASEKISTGQLISLLLTSRLAVSMTFAPTMHQMSHGTDFLIGILIEAVFLIILLLPVWWFSIRCGGISPVDYAYARMGKGGGAVVAGLYGVACLFVQITDLIRFSRFAGSVLSPYMSKAVLCIVLMVTAGIAAFYGLQALGRTAGVIICFVVFSILLAAALLIPQMEAINFPPLLYNGLSPVFRGTFEDLPRSVELAVIGLLIPRLKSSSSLIKGTLIWCGLFAVILLIIQISVVGVLGDFGQMELFPYYTAVTTIRTGTLQRLDIVAAAVWVGALFLKTAFFGMIYVDCFERACGEKGRPLWAAGGALLVLVLALVAGNELPLELERTAIWYTSAGVMMLLGVLLPLAFCVWELCRHRRSHADPPPRKEEAL